jgi:S-DNA-T family DNA segregation ATPase FtsK/SpoIIIE
LKGGSAFYRFKDCKQVKEFSRDPKQAVDVLRAIKEEMDAEEIAIVDHGFEDAKEAGIKKRHFIIIDESADLSDYPEAMDILTEISRKGRSTGHFLILCTQYPLASVIPTSIKRNIISRVCYVVDGPIASNVVLDETGAELLPAIPGRGIYKQNIKKHILQTPFMENKEIERRIQPHVTIKPRKDHDDEQNRHETTTNRKHSIVITKV